MNEFRAAKQLLSLSRFRNPLPLIADRLGWRHKPYSVISRTGTRIEIRPQTGDRYTAFEMFGLGVYDAGLEKLRAGDVVVDIGANIGCFALEAGRRVGPSGKVYAVEPEEQTYNRLVENVRLNGRYPVTPIRGAVAGRSGVLELNVPGRDFLFTSIYKEVDGRPISGTVQRVSCQNLEDLLQSNGIKRVALLKLDCEGAEHEIIDTMSPDLARRIDNLIIEFHNIPGRDIGASIEALKALGYGYVLRQNHLFSR